MSGSEGPRSAPSYKMSYTKAGWIRLHLGSWADNLRVFSYRISRPNPSLASRKVSSFNLGGLKRQMLPKSSKVRIELRNQDTGIILFHTNLAFFKMLSLI